MTTCPLGSGGGGGTERWARGERTAGREVPAAPAVASDAPVEP